MPVKALTSRKGQYACKECDKIYSSKQALADHSRLHTGNAFHCQICDMAFTRKYSLDTHMRIHSGVKPFKCETCKMAFTQKGNLDTHLSIHSGVKPFKCETCDMAFRHKVGLDRHMMIHSGVKPFKCGTCKHSFTQKCDLNRHMLIHSGVKPFKCETCDMAFTQKGGLDRHMLIHSGVKAFTCDMCRAAFTRKDYLISHEELIHDIGKYSCDYCLGKRNTLKEHTDENGETWNVCHYCFKKATTGYTSRIEHQWSDYIDDPENFGTVGLLSTDRALRSSGGCSLKRPDKLYGGPNLVLVCECDEKQHGGQNYSCEQARLSEIYDDPSINGKPMVVARWNPDGYKPPVGQPKLSRDERLRLFVKFMKRICEVRSKVDPHTQPRIIVYYLFYSQDNPNISKDLPHQFIYSESDIDNLVI